MARFRKELWREVVGWRKVCGAVWKIERAVEGSMGGAGVVAIMGWLLPRGQGSEFAYALLCG